MHYRDKFYSKSVLRQTSNLSGKGSLNQIKNQFLVWRRYFSRFLPPDKNIKIIDLGCNDGGFVYWLQQIGYPNSTGIDINAAQISTAENLGIKNVYQADLKEFLKDKYNLYDVIFIRDVIEHFTKAEIMDVLDCIHQSLKKGGKIVIQTPNAESPMSGRFRYGDFTHEIDFTEKSIRQVLAASNLKQIRVFPVRPVVHGFKSFLRAVLWRGIEIILHLYLLIETGSAKGIFTQNLIVIAEKTPNQ